MKNVIFLVCDGLPYDITIDIKGHKSPMVFLNQLRKKCTNGKLVFSQAPYTEAGIMGLMYGRNPLDNGAYLLGMQEWDNSTYKAFYDAGYKLFSSYFGSYIPPEMMVHGQYIYTENYFTPMFSRYIRGKLDYYKNIFDNEGLKNEDFTALIKLIKRHFDTMLLWHSNDADKNDRTGEFQVCEIGNQSLWRAKLQSWKQKVEIECKRFLSRPEEYVNDVFENYDKHFITNDCDVEGLPLKEIFVEQRNWVADKYDNLFRRIRKTNSRFFIKNRQIPLKGLINSLKESKHNFAEHVYRTYQAGWVLDTSKMVATSLPQICSSSRAFVRSLIKWIDEDVNGEPFFAYLHCDEFHRPISFYSQDIADRSLIESEMQHAIEYINGLPKDYTGNVGFDLAAQYLDGCIKELFESLERRNLLDNTIVIVTADHGSSNFGGEVRFTVTNNFFPEQYHIPMVIHNIGAPKNIESFVNIKDIPKTILEYCGIKVPHTFTGNSFLDTYNTSTFVEYLGTGVPDLLRRPIFYQYRDNESAYLLKVNLMQGDQGSEVLEYYDLIKDPKQLNNIIRLIEKNKANELLQKYQKRREELKLNYLNWVTEESRCEKEI